MQFNRSESIRPFSAFIYGRSAQNISWSEPCLDAGEPIMDAAFLRRSLEDEAWSGE